MARLELYGTSRCEHTREMRESLEWRGIEFVEYDVEEDPDAHARLMALANGQRLVPVLVEDGAVIQVGWQGRGCVIAAES
ncbi:MAG TPA: Uxx-star family glutaredoxin-like (seleno)protein [Vicinamibacterales bacterium]|nr:Uxx-star family glutaredoxin-like (seleno)protein [Vicinamibacterales bacterium]